MKIKSFYPLMLSALPGIFLSPTGGLALKEHSFLNTASNTIGVALASGSLYSLDSIQLSASRRLGLSVSAGTDQTVTMPVKQITLTGGIVSSYSIKQIKWEEVSSHSATIMDSSNLTTTVRDLAAGTYIFRLTVTDDNETSSDQVTVTVKPQDAKGAANKTVVVLGSSTAFGYGLSDEDKYVNRLDSYIQSILPGSRIINLAMSNFTTYKAMPDGFHVDGRPDPDINKNITKALSFNPDAILINFPSNDAGNDYSLAEQKRNFSVMTGVADSANIPVFVTTTQPRTFPANKIDSLIAIRDWINTTYGNHAIDFWTTLARPDGLPVPGYQQPDGVHFTAAAHKKLYARVAESGLISSIINYRPVADAGQDVTVNHPLNSVNLTGTGTDSDGIITSYHWEMVSGNGNISNSASATITVTGLVEGASVVRLTVTDNSGGRASDDVTVYTNGATSLAANAGGDVTISQLLGRTVLNGSGSTGAVSYHWELLSGSGTITRPEMALTTAQNITKTSVFRLKVTDNSGNVSFDDVRVSVTPDGFDDALKFNSNSHIPAIPDSMFFQYGSNLGYYGNGWTDTMLARLVRNVGGYTARTGLTDWLVSEYGLNTRVTEYTYMKNNLGLKDVTTFLGEPHAKHLDSTIFPGSTDMSKVFANLYTPIWKVVNNDTVVNENNYFAKYVSEVVQKYTPVGGIKFWEIVNEPDFTYFYDNSNPANVNSWFIQVPKISDLANLKAPVYYYIRLLRVAYEVIKKSYPNSYVATGGIGYSAFLDVILRYTDNPDGGKVTPEYPLTGGGYFDVLSFHSYPYNYLYKWTNDGGGHFVYFRNSDEAVKAMFDFNGLQKYVDVFAKYQYNGSKYPKKPYILSEYNIPRKMFDTRYGGDTAQLNYIIKALVKTQQHGIVQSHIYDLGEHANYSTNFEYDLMGLYENLGRDKKGQEKLTLEGRAFETTAKLLYGWKYDAPRTSQLNLPVGVDGAAFRRGTNYRYVLWAITKNDNSELTSGKYSFPASLGITTVKKYGWNYARDLKVQTVSSTNLSLTGTPVFFEADNNSVVPNQSPKANAGKDITIILPTNTVVLNGSGTDDDGTVVSYKWVKVSGPAEVTIENSNAASARVSGLVQGVYQFQLTVTDDKGATASATMEVIVNAPDNKTPRASVGPDITITLPTNIAKLTGSGSDDDGTIVSYKWTKTSGPLAYTIVNSNAATTDVSGLAEGVYQFQLTVSDDKGAIAAATMKVTVNAAPDKAPTVTAGSDVTITLPANSTKLTGNGRDEDGTITSYKWTKISGPTAYTIVSPNAATTDVNGLTAGVYQFQLTVTDDKGLSASAVMKVTVKSATNKNPTASVGKDVTITLPVNTASLAGSGTDDDGTVVSYRWEKVSGPSGYKIVNPNSALTDAYSLTAGVYEFKLTVTDNQGATAAATMRITVKEPVNKPPFVNAGEDIVIIEPENEVLLIGDASDTDGSILSQHWSQLSGPSTATILLPNNLRTIVESLIPGNYSFILTVSDNKGAVARDTIHVTVAAGRKSFTEGEFKVFPNPIVNQLTVELSDLLPYEKILFSIIDMSGKTIKRGVLAVNGQKYFRELIDLKVIAKGTYVVQFQLPDGRTLKTTKVVKVE